MAEGAVRVMLVEDQPAFRELVAMLLRNSSGFVVHSAELDRWVDDVIEQCPDILLLDLGLGEGEDAVESIPRLVARCPTTMVGALTARAAEEEERSTLAAGAFVFYEKHVLEQLPQMLLQDLALFRRALAGEDVVAPSALVRRNDAPPVGLPAEKGR
jgi:DNA-binding NarL/FixJ family response regulator